MNRMSPDILMFCFLMLVVLSSLNAQVQPIHEEKFVLIGGIEQWITIKGKDVTKPVVLFLHGGPGSPSTPYSDAIFGDWEQDFILVHWDQRGTARTFGRNAPKEVDEEYWINNPLTVEQMTADGIEVSEYLIKRLGKKRIILSGSSWGSVLGVEMALKRPSIFYAYVGHSQLVNPIKDMIQVYHKVSQLVQEKKDRESIKMLETLGPPPYDNAKHTGQLLRLIKKYERENSNPPPNCWWNPAPEYDNEVDGQHRYNGDDYSFIHYAGHKELAIKAMSATINLMEAGVDFNIPVYLIQGREDLLTPVEITQAYFNKINAPVKEMFILPGAAHGFNQSVVDTHYKILIELPLTD
jgi:pimeloyl-ACP methyl ester carboxylesterase